MSTGSHNNSSKGSTFFFFCRFHFEAVKFSVEIHQKFCLGFPFFRSIQGSAWRWGAILIQLSCFFFVNSQFNFVTLQIYRVMKEKNCRFFDNAIDMWVSEAEAVAFISDSTIYPFFFSSLLSLSLFQPFFFLIFIKDSIFIVCFSA